ncbi:MAG TPA: NADH-quinone oxidoreductase subunit A [Pirellulales bacterium]|nr:NADH-quinone oxidoreductase subunit A [Pirellulales bacterium]
MSATVIVAYLALFASVGAVFLFANLLVGKFLRPVEPNAEKLSVYECGEPTIGSSFVQFDLRFYVIALLFIIFDVEVAFFFPWATVFGKATHLMDPRPVTITQRDADGARQTVLVDKVAGGKLSAPTAQIYRDLGVPNPRPEGVGGTDQAIEDSARRLAGASILDILVFFGVLLVGFAYVWRRGDLDWVRAVGQQRALRPARPLAGPLEEDEPVLAA